VTFGHPDNKVSGPPEKGKPKQASGNSTQVIRNGTGFHAVIFAKKGEGR